MDLVGDLEPETLNPKLETQNAPTTQCPSMFFGIQGIFLTFRVWSKGWIFLHALALRCILMALKCAKVRLVTRAAESPTSPQIPRVTT
jgi:hypothetical protein